jgi:hypothetical protein
VKRGSLDAVVSWILEQIGDVDGHDDVQRSSFDRSRRAGGRTGSCIHLVLRVHDVAGFVHSDGLNGQDGLARSLSHDVCSLAGVGHGKVDSGQLGLFKGSVVDVERDAVDRVSAVVSNDTHELSCVLDSAHGDGHAVVHVIPVERGLLGSIVIGVMRLEAVSGRLDVLVLDAGSLKRCGDLRHDGVVVRLCNARLVIVGENAEADASNGGFDRDLAGAGHVDGRYGRRRVSFDRLSGADSGRERDESCNRHNQHGLHSHKYHSLLHRLPPVLHEQDILLSILGEVVSSHSYDVVASPEFPGPVKNSPARVHRCRLPGHIQRQCHFDTNSALSPSGSPYAVAKKKAIPRVGNGKGLIGGEGLIGVQNEETGVFRV